MVPGGARRWRWLHACIGALVLLAVAPACEPADPPPCDVTWVGATSGDWADPGNWSAGALPTDTERACAPADTAITVTTAVGAASFDLRGSVTITPTGTLALTADSVITQLDLAGHLTGRGGVLGDGLHLSGGSIDGQVIAAYTGTVASSLDGGTIDDSAMLLLGSGFAVTAPLQLCGSAGLHLLGTLDLATPTTLTTAGCATVTDPVFAIESPATAHVTAPLTAPGITVITNGTLDIDADLTAATLTQGAGTTTLTSPGTAPTTHLTLTGATGTPGAGTYTLLAGTLTGTGTLDADLTGAGTLDPGTPAIAGPPAVAATAGDLAITGNYTATPGVPGPGLNLDLFDATTTDTLHVGGTATITDAALTTPTAPTYHPTLGTTHALLTAATLTGPAAATTIPAPFLPDYHPTELGLHTCTIAGAGSDACPPLPLGGPTPTWGNHLTPGTCPQDVVTLVAPCGPQPRVWAAINGPYDNYANGDPYATRCSSGGGSGTTCTQGNPLYRATGYDYAVDVGLADIGKPLTVSTYDIGAYPRTIGNDGANVGARSIPVASTAGSNIITSAGLFTATDAGRKVFGPGVPANATIQSVTNASSARLSATIAATRSIPLVIGNDCNSTKAPFTTAPFSGVTNSGICQTGDDSDAQNVDVQLYDPAADGAAATTNPVSDCHQLVLAADPWATTKNRWTDVCTFTPTRAGRYDLRVRNSGLAGLTDTGTGTNLFALDVAGGTGTSLYALNDASSNTSVPSATGTFYLAQIPSWYAGHKIDLDLFDVGDGSSANPYTVQLKAPPGGAPGAVPGSGATTIPAAGIASGCTYNASPSTTRGPATPNTAAACTVTTHLGTGANYYNGAWLRIEVALDPAYSCTSDCFWTITYDTGTTPFQGDRATWSVTAKP